MFLPLDFEEKVRYAYHVGLLLNVNWRTCVALSSAADLSCLEISSRTSRSRESWSIILKVEIMKFLYSYVYISNLIDLCREGKPSITVRLFAGVESKQVQ